MRTHNIKAILNAAARVFGLLLFGAVVTFGQQQVNLTAGSANATLPDGTVVPMWGYSCGTGVTGSTATCAPLNPAAITPAIWSPVVITVPTGQSLTINLTNHLSFTPTGSTTPNTVPTSLVIVGQLGGGLGTTATTTPATDHTNAQPLTWPIAGNAPGAPLTSLRPGTSARPGAAGAATSEPFTPVTALDSSRLAGAAYSSGDLASAKAHFEEAVLRCLGWLHERVPVENLVTAGGCALNGVCNARILRDTPFKRSYIQCAASDDGTALGAALYVWNVLLNQPRSGPIASG